MTGERVINPSLHLNRRETANILHVQTDSGRADAHTPQPTEFLRICPVGQIYRGKIELIIIHHKTGTLFGICRVNRFINRFKESMISRFLPTIVQSTTIGIQSKIGIFHLVNQCLVESLSTPMVLPRQSQTETPVSKSGRNRPREFGFTIPVGYLIERRVFTCSFPVTSQKYFLTGSRVDTQGAYYPNGGLRVTVFITG